jgi:ribosomal protein S18 acetylase RimI-like enzyme
MVADLTGLPPDATGPSPLPIRQPLPEDRQALARLMLDAYRDTIDYEGETLTDTENEIAKTFAGAYGRFLPGYSFLALDGDEPASASIVTRYEGAPFLAFSMTSQRWKGKGLARHLIRESMLAIRNGGETTLALVVTAGNGPAEHLYESMGFVEVGSGK